MIGKTILQYRILEKLGEGGMGVVYKAHDTKLDRVVALKFLPHYLTSDAIEKERFYHEARAASSLLHGNVAVVFEINEHDGQVFIAMEYVEGRTLKEVIEKDTLSLKNILDIAIQAADGLAAAHEKGIVHRDVKSENIMVTPKGQPKITDFGLAKVKGATKLTKAGSTLGTAAYMSPEQAEGEEVDHRSDIFSFGVVLYELLTGRLPFRGDHHAALLYSIVNEDPPPIARFNERASEDLQRIVAKALAKDREERYQHADEIVADLRRERKAIDYAKTAHARSAAMEPPAPAGAAPPADGVHTAAEPPRRAAEPAPPAPRAKPKRAPAKYLVPAAIVAAAVILIVLFNPFNLQIGLKKTAARDRKSVAVLPFTNMSGNEADQFFSDGITDDIIAQLSNIADLRVISRTSVMQYKDRSKNLRDIARELGVATILEGSVRRADNQVRIVAQLIDASTDEHLWAQTYDRELTQIFAIQSDVARQIAAALEAELSPREAELIAKKPTENLDAYAYYLKGREYYYRYTERDNDNAIELFKKALELDPDYALAYAGLGDAYGQTGQRWRASRSWIDSSIAASSKAIALDPNCAEGYKALGLGYIAKGWVKKSLEANLKALEINPNYGPALGNLGAQMRGLGKYDEALTYVKKALASDPMIPNSYLTVGFAYLALRDYEKALEWFDKGLALQPDLPFAHMAMGMLHMAQGEYERCLDVAKKALSIRPSDRPCLFLAGWAEFYRGNYAEAERFIDKVMAIDSAAAYTDLGTIYWVTGRKEEARRLFALSIAEDERQLAEGNEDSDIRYDMAAIYAALGNKKEAYHWLEEAIETGWRGYDRVEFNPLLESIRGEERFKRMMAGVKAQVDEMRKRVEEMEKK